MKVLLGVLIGFALGVLAFQLPVVKAQNSFIRVIPISMVGMNPGSGAASGEIVGFSCVPETHNAGDSTCYIASR